MTRLLKGLSRGAELVAAIMMAAMFATFILQVTIRYTARLEWLPNYLPFLAPEHFGWTLEFCLLMWLWIIFWNNAFVVRERDHVTFDILYTHVSPKVRQRFAVITGLAIFIGLIVSIGPTWDKFHILRLKKTATLSNVFGDWIRVRDIYSIYILFLGAVAARYAWRAWSAFRKGPEADLHHYEDLAR